MEKLEAMPISLLFNSSPCLAHGPSASLPYREKGTASCPAYGVVKGFFSVVVLMWLHVPNQMETRESSTVHPIASSRYALHHHHRECREDLGSMGHTHMMACQQSHELYLLRTPKVWHVKRASPDESLQGRMSPTSMVSPVIGGCSHFCSEVTWPTLCSTTPDCGALALLPVLWQGGDLSWSWTWPSSDHSSHPVTLHIQQLCPPLPTHWRQVLQWWDYSSRCHLHQHQLQSKAGVSYGGIWIRCHYYHFWLHRWVHHPPHSTPPYVIGYSTSSSTSS